MHAYARGQSDDIVLIQTSTYISTPPTHATWRTCMCGQMVNGNVCPEANIVIEDADYCNTGFPDYDHEGMICANDGSATQAYCSYDVGPKACARCSSERRANALTGKGPGGSEQLKLRALHERIMKNIAFGKLGAFRERERAIE